LRQALAILLIALVVAPIPGGPHLLGSEIGNTLKSWSAQRHLFDAIWRGDNLTTITNIKDLSKYSPTEASSWLPTLAHQIAISNTAPHLNQDSGKQLSQVSNSLTQLYASFSWMPDPYPALSEAVIIYGMRYLPLRETLSEQGVTLVEPLPEPLSILLAVGGHRGQDANKYVEYLQADLNQRRAIMNQSWRALAVYADVAKRPH